MHERRNNLLPGEQILSFEEIELIEQAFVDLGANKTHLTGREPLIRKGIDSLVEKLSTLPYLEELNMSGNYSQLSLLASLLTRLA